MCMFEIRDENILVKKICEKKSKLQKARFKTKDIDYMKKSSV